MSESKNRRPRADSLRNRELIIKVARDAFAERGTSVTLDEVVKLTGLGVGTMYRHFPSRDALIEAVYTAEVERLGEAARELAASEPPVEALRKWMMVFVEYMATKAALKETLNALTGGTDKLYANTTGIMKSAIDSLIERAVASGELKVDIEPLDLLRAIGSVDASSAPRMIDILIAGLKA